MNNTKLMTFDTWFLSTGRPVHHKKGMQAYTDTKGKKSVDYWNQVFSTY